MGMKAEVSGRSRTAPKGHFVVYVGSKMTRFVIPTSYLKEALFQELLDKSAEEYGFHNRSKLLLPCEESYFQGLVNLLAQS